MATPNTYPPMLPEGGFWRVDQDGIFHHAKNFVYAPWGSLLRGRHLAGQYTYPQPDGWRWFDTYDQAIAFYGLEPGTMPLGYVNKDLPPNNPFSQG